MTTATAPKADVDVTRSGNGLSGRFSVTLPTVTRDEVLKPAFAAVGVADLAIEQVKDVPAEVTAKGKELQARVSERTAAVPAQVKALPEQASARATEVRGTVTSKAEALRTQVQDRVEKARTEAQGAYASLVQRGERLVAQIRRQPSTEAAIAEGKEAVKKAEASVAAAKKSAQSGGQAVEDAAAKLG